MEGGQRQTDREAVGAGRSLVRLELGWPREGAMGHAQASLRAARALGMLGEAE